MAMDVGGGGSKVKVRPSMNVTPLVDVVLVLLIIFMVITPMLVKQMWMHYPKKDVSTQQEDDAEPDPSTAPIVVNVLRDGTIRINKEVVAANDLSPKLSRILAARRDPIVFFDSDDDLPYGKAMEVMDLARGGGAAHIVVLTEAVKD